MKKRFAMALLAGILGAIVSAQWTQAANEGMQATNAVFVPASDMKFIDVPGFPGLQTAVAEGDPAKGPHHFYLKFAAGFAAPVHHHTADHYATVVSGTLVLTVDGKEHKLLPGSYFAFTGKADHATKCEAGADCVVFIDVRGPWDVVPLESKAAAKK